MMKPTLFLALLLAPLAAADDTVWPPVTREAKPWTRWWWLGSGVDAPGLSKQLEDFSKAGLGGVEICPIYGAKGHEKRDLPFLSEAWTRAYAHAASEADRLDLGLDLTTGTGWPFGGPWVGEDLASASLIDVKITVTDGKQVELPLPKGRVEVLKAWPESGEPLDLSDKITGDRLLWTPPAGKWSIHGLISKHGIQKVKRSAPGGAGWVLDPFSTSSMEAYLKAFDTALDRPDIPEPRAHFHDSFEYYGAAWTDNLLARFQELQGYDLRSQLPALQGEGDPDTIARVRADYRETMSDLHRGYLATWHDWAKNRGSLTRNQAHGSPGNLLDHYAVADIPETEIFRHVDEAQIPMLQFASSAAHLSGKNLVSAETFTWLDEHFRVTPAKLKEAADFVWLGGVNHIFFHGIPYSPQDAGWPGWLFYASTHMGPNGGLWREMPAFTSYIARCQAMLQSGTPDAEVLLYFPMHDLWHDGAAGLPLFTVHNQDKWLHPSSFYRAAMAMWQQGIPCDFVSDRLLSGAKVEGGRIRMGTGSYKTLLIPETRFMSAATARHLLDLAGKGARIGILGDPPRKAPGFQGKEEGSRELTALFAPYADNTDSAAGAGFISRGDLARCLSATAVKSEPMAGKKLRFVRRKHEDGWSYFIVNSSGAGIDTKLELATPLRSSVMFDPMRGVSGVSSTEGGIRLVLAAGESRILRTYRAKQAEGPPWLDREVQGEAITLAGDWQIEFIEGGPELPAAYHSKELSSWAKREGNAYRNFSGTARYRLEFDWNGESPALLDLGEIAHTARATLNGTSLGSCWAPPHRLMTGDALKPGKNLLEIEVTNLAANRIADLDRRKVSWKSFHEINFVNIDYKPFDAAGWASMDSGLLGPVKLIPLR